jgi:hypothetical protein
MAKKKTGRTVSRPWTAEAASQILDEIKSLGVTDSEFSRQRGLKIGRIAWWRQKLGRSRRVRVQNQAKLLVTGSEPAGGFVELKAVSVVPAETRIEVTLRNGRSVFLPRGVATERLTILLDAIEGTLC